MLLNKNMVKDKERIEISDVLLSSEELENHAKTIAKNHSVTKRTRKIQSVINRLDHNFETIVSVYEHLNQKAYDKRNFSPASEWLLDNFYKIEEQVKVIREEITKRNFLDLNVLDRGFLKGFPRSYAIALELVSHTDGSLDEEVIVRFVNAYQTYSALSISELWSLSSMIRVALVEKIRNVCEMIHLDQLQFERIEKISGKDPEEIFSIIKEELECMQEIDTSYIHHLLRKLRREEIDSGKIMDYIEKKLFDFNMTTVQIIDWEHKEQAARKIAIGNAIISLNVVSKFNWNHIFETLCVAEKILREDPTGIYEQMDFESRDYYRHHIVRIAKQCNVSEIKVARKAVECAKEAYQQEKDEKQKHVGYYVIGKGRKRLFQELGCKKSPDMLHSNSVSIYLSGIFLITVLIAGALGFYAYRVSGNLFISILAGIVTLVPASDIAVTGINWLTMRMIPPTFLPKMEYREGIPDEAATIVVIPALLTSVEMVEKLLERLEIYYAGNKDKNIFFGLIGDFKDGKNETEPEDEKIENAAAEGIRRLNKKYGRDGDRFFYLHRRRQYNEKQKLWMGWERKRGALVEFNEWLLGAKDTSFYRIVGNPANLIGKIRYVITLDADTRLYLDVARKLIGTIAHPLHHAVLDGEKKIVVDGYGLIQPKIGIDVDSANHSVFTKIYAGQGGIDTYSTAVSDVYQDLMGEGIFTGKGIYDLHAFSNTLTKAIPDNTLLSHDLLEGSYLRTGLATDIELIDGYPGKYSSFMVRLHRWVRGDWQLIRWLKGTIRDRTGRKIKNPLSLLSRWKIFDNLRRSLVSVSLLLLFILGLTVFPGRASIWIGFGFFVFGMPLWLEGLSLICSGFQGCGNRKLNRNIIYGAKAVLYQIVLQFVFLPYHAYLMSDAILRTLYRVWISKTNLLEWTTAADVERRLKNDLQSFIKRMRMAIVIALILLILVLLLNVQNTAYAVLFGVIWAVSPAVAYWISREEKEEILRLGEADHQTLRRIARKTWAYYEDFAGAQDHYLPPDNYQENPPNGVAHRTSPTNIGFYLLSILAARDLGYLTTGKMLEKINQTLTTVEKLDTWKGHLYNWYNTKTLELLRPMYISTVDSGNFIGYLITLKQGLLEYLERPILDPNLIRGLKDTFELIDEEERADVDFSILSRREEMTWNEWIEWIDAAQSVQKELPKDICETLRPTPFNQKQFLECLSKVNWAKKFQNMLEDLQTETDRLFVAPISQEEKESGGEIYNQLEVLGDGVSLNALKELYDHLLRQADQRMELDFASDAEKEALQRFKEKINTAKNNVESMIGAVHDLVSRIDGIVEETDFSPLYDPKKNLFSIGYDVHENKLTNSYYDLLASEARVASYIAVTRRQVPKIHWKRLGRTLTIADGYKALVSWTGTMFEYFMPPLILKNYRNTLMDETYATVINAQKQYGKKRNVPWGTSESGYYAFDMHLNYQYKAFGVPDLGLKRGLVNDMVISPYSTILGLPFEPQGVMENLYRLIRDGVEGAYGFYEAIDYTPERLVHRQKKELVRNFMAHHQGMILLALNNYLNDNTMQKRFHSDPVIASGEILLQEKIPVRAIITKEYKEPVRPLEVPKREEIKLVRKYHELAEILPRCHILSNGKYFVMVTDAGSGYSKNEGIQVSRWREDRLAGKYGTFIFLRDVEKDRVWTSAFDPLGVEPDGYQVNFSLDKAEFFRTDENIDTHTEIVVSPEDDVEIRKVSLTNHRSEPVLIEVTSYFETVLADQAADVAHPAFSNLFIRTEAIEQYGALIASRRPRMEGNPTIWAAHISVVEGGETIGNMQYETNRSNFIGRGRDISDPVALSKPLSNTTGPVLDPIMSIRRLIKIPPGESATVTYITGVAKDRETILEIAQKYHDPASIERSFQLAYTRSQMEMAYLDLKAEEVETYQDMISHIVFLSPCRKKYEDILKKNQRGQSNLWAYGISGDYPIVLLSIKREEDMDQVIQLLKAHEYWRMKGLSVALVILNEDESSYLQPLQQLLKETVRNKYGNDMQDRPGGVFIRDANGMPKEDIHLLYAAARIILKAENGSIRAQLKVEDYAEELPEEKRFSGEILSYPSKEKPLGLDYFNDYGGFQKDGKAYVIRLKEDMHTPAPWINVLSNKGFGCIVTESGSGFTWAENSRENKLTPWSNDPVSDTPGEAIYLRDEENGEFWTITPLPVRRQETYTVYHGLGYSRFEHHSCGLEQELTIFVSKEDPIKISRIKLKNESSIPRKLTLTYYANPVMGVSEGNTKPYLITQMDAEKEMMMIRNPYSMDFPNRILFMASSEPIRSWTGDREEFLGMRGSMKNPAALKREGLSNRTGAGLDPCAAIQIEIEIQPDEQKECVFLMGQAQDRDEAYQWVKLYRDIRYCEKHLQEVQEMWNNILETVQVKTPDLSMDLLLNNWLLYQNIACRQWARSAFYQAGGAFGFRDQLQDAMNSVWALPQVLRDQILLHSAHQFVEGDVQHWWHPGAGEKGIRTRFSDDLLWLPLAVAEYVKYTDDWSILKEEVSFLLDEPLGEDEDERYGVPRVAEEKASVYEHCIRAIERSLKFGEHGIPLMGSGDWNDGMSTVGNKGKGESVWLGWFLATILLKFEELCKKMGDEERGQRYAQTALRIAQAIEENAWDGSWYRRAYFDDGTPLGSIENEECTIDSIAQSWAVISGLGREERIKEAMASVERHLIRWDAGMILLFTPPFEKSDLHPGYIKGYVAGVRENGGQYTHAATWVIYAFALMGEGDKAWKLYNLINPINHTRTSIECAAYKVEPYAIAADVYSTDPHVGRGGWTWYTGAAGWMYRVGLESILGFIKKGDRLLIQPCIPKDWEEYHIRYRYMNTDYHIMVKNPEGVNTNVKSVSLDGQLIEEKEIRLMDDGKTHRVEVIMGKEDSPI